MKDKYSDLATNNTKMAIFMCEIFSYIDDLQKHK